GRESKEKGRIFLKSKGAAVLQQEFDFEGGYILRARGYGEKGTSDGPPTRPRHIHGKDVKTVDVTATSADKPGTYEARTKVTAGKHGVALQFANGADANAKDAKDGKKNDRTLSVIGLDVEGPFNALPRPLPESHRRIMVAK